MKTKLLSVCLVLNILMLVSGCAVKRVVQYVKTPRKSTPAEKKYYQTVPFQYVGNHIVLEATINKSEKVQHFVLDTGAPTLVSQELFAEYNLPYYSIFRDSSFAIGLDNKRGSVVKSFNPMISHLQIGNTVFEEVGARVIDISKLSKFSCYSDGLIGANVMNDGVWQINYQDNTITFTNDLDKLEYIEGAYELKFKNAPVTKTPLVDLKINGEKFTFVFDTGNAMDEFVMHPEAAKKISESLTNQRKQKAVIYGVFNAYTDSTHKQLFDTDYLLVNDIKIGNLGQKDVKVAGIDMPVTNSKHYEGLIGNEFLKNYIVTLNWKKKKIYLYPNQNFIQKSYQTYGVLAGYEGNEIIVKSIIIGSEADKAGLKAGEKILQIDDFKTDNLSDDKICELYSTTTSNLLPENNKNITLTIQHHDGRTGTYTFNQVPLFPGLELSDSATLKE